MLEPGQKTPMTPDDQAQRTRTGETRLILPEARRRCGVRCSARSGGGAG